MFKITRQFIRDRQPHTDFAVDAVPAQAWPHTVPGWNSQDRVQMILREHSDLRACWGWRVGAWNPESQQVLVRPHWHIVSAQGDRFWHTDTDLLCESVLDQALAVYYRGGIQGASSAAREPADLVWHQAQWWSQAAGQLHALEDLSQASICAVPRSTAVVLACSG